MADMTFNTTAGQTVDRELLIAYLNTGEAGGCLEGYSRHDAHDHEETHHHADL